MWKIYRILSYFLFTKKKSFIQYWPHSEADKQGLYKLKHTIVNSIDIWMMCIHWIFRVICILFLFKHVILLFHMFTIFFLCVGSKLALNVKKTTYRELIVYFIRCKRNIFQYVIYFNPIFFEFRYLCNWMNTKAHYVKFRISYAIWFQFVCIFILSFQFKSNLYQKKNMKHDGFFFAFHSYRSEYGSTIRNEIMAK